MITPGRVIQKGMIPCEANNPAVKIRESPGKKNPKNNPDSAKMIAISPATPKVFKIRVLLNIREIAVIKDMVL